MHLLANSITSKLSWFAQVDPSGQGSAGGVLLFVLALVIAVAVNLGKDNAVSAKVKRRANVTDPNWGMMFGLFVFALMLGSLPNLFNLIFEDWISEKGVNGFRVSGLIIAIFTGLYLVFRTFCESSKVREPEQAWRLAVVSTATILGALYLGVTHDDDSQWSDKFKLGVDLAGGVNLVYKIEMQDPDPGETQSGGMNDQEMQGLLSALGRRLNPSGKQDLIIRPYGNNTHVEIVLPNATDEEIRQLKEVITNTGALEFMIQVGVTDTDEDHKAVRDAVSESFESTYNSMLVENAQGETIGRWVKVGKDEDGDFEYDASGGDSLKRVFYRESAEADAPEVETPVLLWNSPANQHFDRSNAQHLAIESAFNDGNPRTDTSKDFSARVRAVNVSRVEVLMVVPERNLVTTGEDLKSESTRSSYDDNLRPSVAFRMKATSAGKFGRFTAKNVGKQLSIVLDGNLLSSANIRQRISEHGTITGDFTQAEVDYIIGILRAGALPGTLNPTPESENKMGASLGTATISKGTYAISLSLAIVLIFMMVWYFGVPGFVAAFALVLNLILVLGVMVLIGASFTLSGMAGLVLTVGMAVDANVLIFERIREELADGAKIKAAIRNGFSRATITIIDANLTTMITAILLYAIGTDQIRGFAITLILGIIMSMFTAIYASRGIFVVAAGLKLIGEQSRTLRPSQLNSHGISFMRKARITAGFSIVIIVAGLFVTFQRQGGMLAIDLSGGTSAIFELSTGEDDDAIEEKIESYVDNNSVTSDGQQFQFSVTSVEFEGGKQAWRVNTNLTDQDKLENLLASVFDAGLRKQSISVEVISEQTQETESSAVEPIIRPQFVSYQENTTQESSTEDATEDATEDVGPKSPVDAGPQPPTPPVTPDDALEIPTPEETGADEVNQITLEIKLRVGDKPVALKSSELIGMVEAAAGQANIEVGNIRSDGRNAGQVTIFDIEDAEAAAIRAELLKSDGATYFEETQKFGAQIAGDMKSLGAVAIVFSFIGIITYIWMRFQHVSFGIAAVVALVHDILVTLAAIALSKYLVGFAQIEEFKISLPVIAAFLTIIGYSLNDTIVVFDRVREVRGKSREITADMLDRSVNSTLSRTLLTSLTTLFVVGTLYLAGGSGIHSFSFALVIGVVVGTYSSIFVASPTLLLLNRKKS